MMTNHLNQPLCVCPSCHGKGSKLMKVEGIKSRYPCMPCKGSGVKTYDGESVSLGACIPLKKRNDKPESVGVLL